MDRTGDLGREAGTDMSTPRATEVHAHLAGGATSGTTDSAAAEQKEGVVNRVREGAEETVNRLREAGHDLQDRVHDVREKLDDGWTQTRDRVRGAMNDAEELLEERTGLLPWVRNNPLPATMIAFGAGLVVSGGALAGRRGGVRGQLRAALLSSLGGALVSEVRGFLDGTLRS
jgi:ElaB/YqjD/DUF883 family membrane-anchored ribosome-binding protein